LQMKVQRQGTIRNRLVSIPKQGVGEPYLAPTTGVDRITAKADLTDDDLVTVSDSAHVCAVVTCRQIRAKQVSLLCKRRSVNDPVLVQF
jgi:hypothetical protein